MEKSKKKEREISFARMVAHELKNPLAAIKSLADALNQSENVPTEVYREFMRDICTEIDRENDIINDLLALSDLEDGRAPEMEEMDLTAFLGQLLKLYTPLARQSQVTLELENEEAFLCRMDRGKLSLIMKNLIENAIKYSHPSGKVRISAGRKDAKLFLQVKDNGRGIAKEYSSRIFDPFYRIDENLPEIQSGSGLGLYIADRAVKILQGRIWVESDIGVGSTFYVELPISY